MNPIRFKIEFITPLLIGGAGKDSCDPLSLGKALRGGWRFWFRAVCGGMIQGADSARIAALHQLESAVFGSTKNATFRLLVTRDDTVGNQQYPRCPHKTGGDAAKREGCRPGATFAVTITPRKELAVNQLAVDALKASIWLWGNLGSCGNRARRGFGSPILLADATAFINLPMTEQRSFAKRPSLVSHLKDGVLLSIEAIMKYVSACFSELPEVKLFSYCYSENRKFFELSDLRQIMVAKTPSANDFTTDELNGNPNPYLLGVFNRVHGKRDNNEIGMVNPRFSSPVYVRIHVVNGEYLPVATWSRHSDIPIGTSPNTALDYLKKIDFNRLKP